MKGTHEIERMILEMAEKIRREYRPTKIILFGSYAYGEPDGDSDIDMLIIKETGGRLIDRMVEVARIAYDPNRLIPFEPIVLTSAEIEQRIRIGDQFVQGILDQGEVLYAAS